MGKLEEGVQRRAKKKNLQQIILATVSIAGVLGVGLFAPNVVGAMARLGILPSRRQKELIKRSRDRLVDLGYLEVRDRAYRLTPKGEARLSLFESQNFQFKKPKRWDGKWRVLIFDIAEERRPLREKVRRTLTAVGFQRLQDSVWIFPYDCEDLITLLKADFKVGKDVLYIVVEEIEGDGALRSRFNLTRR